MRVAQLAPKSSGRRRLKGAGDDDNSLSIVR